MIIRCPCGLAPLGRVFPSSWGASAVPPPPMNRGIFRRRSASTPRGSNLHERSPYVHGRPPRYTGVVTQLVTHLPPASTQGAQFVTHTPSSPVLAVPRSADPCPYDLWVMSGHPGVEH
jgi:hypothetical protein